ncbi:hypothetical protein TCAL_08039 [Tigriopus californicus]|uniref:isoleucine--tRNA ligase n=1 Tax=Tigriopus californicus TaxID=6832 RepID=A0A553NN98_TIGCA|nr:isoleucine--tRNA ligase, mitochondrial-like [Tigriopus californicus]TRY66923.1 hypothetical protein TCAL_08039 [Tigriopus californicus]|eukprot:TCALIF_08039-PA protein Name:"Similar to IARS2 Isoleucine--tRNA ligase, mitochondrial (Gallus gallus)" AED:0.01 eAED:0.01 QI:84/1/1/1/1/1/3/10/992
MALCPSTSTESVNINTTQAWHVFQHHFHFDPSANLIKMLTALIHRPLFQWKDVRHTLITPAIRALSHQKPPKYSSTVLLPRTNFPARLEGAKRLAQDQSIVNSTAFQSLYARQWTDWPPENTFILHDGPPYANGTLHMGHVVNKVLKDITNRWQLTKGRRVHYRPGWDCHGLPIELKAKRKTGTPDRPSPLEIRNEARKFAQDTVEAQQSQFQSWGILGDWDHPYLTMDPDYVEREMRLCHRLIQNGLMFQRYMPVYWSPSSQTALAESELEYNPNHKSISAYIKFPLCSESCRQLSIDSGSLLIWTTTPWSIVANRAVCVKSDAEYCLIQIADEFLIVGQAALANNPDLKTCLGDHQVIKVVSGQSLTHLKYSHPIKSVQGSEVEFPVLSANHVTMTAGTGLVHTAPAHGPDDYLVGLEHGLDLSCPVDENGCYIRDIGPELRELSVLGDGNTKIVDLLQASGHLLSHGDFFHSYPCDWRTKQPVILRASKQWFIDTTSLKSSSLSALKFVDIQPASWVQGFQGVLEKRPYWCVSRQRVWGVPIPVFYHKESQEVLSNDEIIQRCCELNRSEGTDFWWKMSAKDILMGTGVNGDDYEKGGDILDVWFDSGITWSTLPEVPADLYLEGLDQFSGWFYSSLVTGMALQKQCPYKNIFVHGFTVDEQGRKMSKSTGNVVDPSDLITGTKKKSPYGVDTVRLWVAAHASQSSSIEIGDSIMDLTKQTMNKIRNSCKFILGNTSRLTSREQLSSYEDLRPVDRLALLQLAVYWEHVSIHFEQMKFNLVCLRLDHYLANDLSSFYFHITKDRLYCDEEASLRRRSAQTVLFHILETLKASFAPIAPILAQEIENAHPVLRPSFGSRIVPENTWKDEKLESSFRFLFDLKSKLTKELGDSNLKNCDVLAVTKTPHRLPEDMDAQDLAEFLQVPKVSICDQLNYGSMNAKGDDIMVENEMLTLRASHTEGCFCPRCRLKTAMRDNELCQRCESVIRSLQ